MRPALSCFCSERVHHAVEWFQTLASDWRFLWRGTHAGVSRDPPSLPHPFLWYAHTRSRTCVHVTPYTSQSQWVVLFVSKQYYLTGFKLKSVAWLVVFSNLWSGIESWSAPCSRLLKLAAMTVLTCKQPMMLSTTSVDNLCTLPSLFRIPIRPF